MAPHRDSGTSGRAHLTPSDLPLPPRSPHLNIPQAAPPRLDIPAQEGSLKSGSTSSYLVISGGTGCNAICAAFAQRACYVLPVSDDGGSSSEIIRVLGGPSIGNLPPSHPFTPHPSMRCVAVEEETASAAASHAYNNNAQVTFARVSYA